MSHSPISLYGAAKGRRQLRHEVIAVQSAELHPLYDEHRISDTTRRRLQHDLDREEAALGTR